jgi:Tfp pilus assembly protein PilV
MMNRIKKGSRLSASGSELLATNSGQTLFEIVFAIVVTSIALIAVINLATISIRNTTFSRDKTLASRHTQEAVEWLRGQRDADWNAFASNVSKSSSWCLAGLSWTSDGTHQGTCGGAGDFISGTKFKRSVSFTSVTSDTISFDVATSWDDANGTHVVSASNVFTNWKSR